MVITEEVFYTTETDRYSEYEGKSPSKHLRKSITGSMVGSNKCVGYCQYPEHSGFLTQEQRKEHDCLGKECSYYLAKPKREKEQKEPIINPVSDLLPLIQKTISNEAVKVIRVTETEPNKITAFFISITNDYSFAESTRQLQENYGIDVTFSRLDYDFDTCVKLLYQS